MPKSPPADQNQHKKNDGDARHRNENDADGRRLLMRYAGLSGQVAFSVLAAVWLGIKADNWLKLSFPIFSLGLPLLVIVVVLIEIIKANSGKNEK